MFECLGGILTPGAGGGDIAVPGGVGAEVALPRSHLVEATRRELIEAHEQVGSEGGGVRVSGWVGCGLFPFLHKEVLALYLQLRV